MQIWIIFSESKSIFIYQFWKWKNVDCISFRLNPVQDTVFLQVGSDHAPILAKDPVNSTRIHSSWRTCVVSERPWRALKVIVTMYTGLLVLWTFKVLIHVAVLMNHFARVSIRLYIGLEVDKKNCYLSCVQKV